MSSIVVVDIGEQVFLLNLTSGDYTLHLYQTDITAGLTPDEIDQLVAADFNAVEADFPGYAAQTLTGRAWTITQGNPTAAVHDDPKSFIRSSTGTAQNIFGYYVRGTGILTGTLFWFEQFDGPITVEFEDDEIDITPELALDDAEGNAVESGTIVATGRATAPTGWLLCDGTAVSRTTFADLFAAIGTAYGIGDGSTTFNVPDLRQRFPLGKADAGTGATLGGTGGAIDHVHGLDTASSHARVSIRGASPNKILEIQRKNVSPDWNEANRVSSLSGTSDATEIGLGSALGGNSDTENPPFQTVNYLVKT